MTVIQNFDAGNIFSPAVLGIDENELVESFLSDVKVIAVNSLALYHPAIVSVTHTFVSAYMKLMSRWSFEGAGKVSFFVLVSRLFPSFPHGETGSAGGAATSVFPAGDTDEGSLNGMKQA